MALVIGTLGNDLITHLSVSLGVIVDTLRAKATESVKYSSRHNA